VHRWETGSVRLIVGIARESWSKLLRRALGSDRKC
jgi:hypothetical protein